MDARQQKVWKLVRRARTMLEEACELENEIETDRLSIRDRFSPGNSGYVDPLGARLDRVLDTLEEVLT